MPASPLTDEEKEDAKRLRQLFHAFQASESEQGRKSTQLELAERLGFGQSALSQYLNGKIPLNGPALAKFSKLLQVEPARISPSIVAAERARIEAVGTLSPGAIQIALLFDDIKDPGQKRKVQAVLLGELSRAAREANKKPAAKKPEHASSGTGNRQPKPARTPSRST